MACLHACRHGLLACTSRCRLPSCLYPSRVATKGISAKLAPNTLQAFPSTVDAWSSWQTCGSLKSGKGRSCDPAKHPIHNYLIVAALTQTEPLRRTTTLKPPAQCMQRLPWGVPITGGQTWVVIQGFRCLTVVKELVLFVILPLGRLIASADHVQKIAAVAHDEGICNRQPAGMFTDMPDQALSHSDSGCTWHAWCRTEALLEQAKRGLHSAGSACSAAAAGHAVLGTDLQVHHPLLTHPSPLLCASYGCANSSE